MDTEDIARLKQILVSEYVMVSRNKMYYLLSGAIMAVVTVTGVSVAGVVAYLWSEPVEIARRRILEIQREAEVSLERINADSSYVRTGKRYFIRHNGSSLDIHVNGASDQPMMELIQNRREGPQSWFLDHAE